MTSSEDQYTHRITLLRHGESTGNAAGVYQGRAEFDLSEKGSAQARALGEFWRANGTIFTQVISSPQSRARQTAEIISGILELPLVLDDQWQEIDNGVLAGLSLEAAAQEHPFPEFMTPFDPIGESGESNWGLYLRAGRAVQELVNKPSGSYLVVSHGGFLNRVLYMILGITPQVNFSGARFQFGNTSYAMLEYNAARHIWLVKSLNSSPHNPPG